MIKLAFLNEMLSKFARHVIAALILSIGLTACQPSSTAPTDAPKPIALESRNFVQSAHAALNADDVEAFAATVDFPLHVRTQKWTTGGSADYFVLLPGEERIIETAEALEIDGLVESLNLESDVSDASDYDFDSPPFSQHPDLHNAHPIWSKLDLTVHLVYFGDVEHIAIFGTKRESGKVRAIYIN